MSNKYTTNKNAIADCDVCGFQYKLKQLKSLFVRKTKTNILACPSVGIQINHRTCKGCTRSKTHKLYVIHDQTRVLEKLDLTVVEIYNGDGTL
jgi:hypothetical protein